MTTRNVSTPFAVGTPVKIRNSGYPKAWVAEDRGLLGPKGTRIYRVLVQRKPRPVYIEVREDQLEALNEKTTPGAPPKPDVGSLVQREDSGAILDMGILYLILAPVARRGGQITYGGVSREYHRLTGEWHEPHGTWDHPLGEINRRLHAAGLPGLSALVVLDGVGEPGGGFWGSASNVPPRPASETDRIATYARILGDVHATPWPEELPPAS